MNQFQENNCLILCRVSTLKQAQQGESIEVQEKICRGIAERQNLQVYKIFHEYFSGRKDKRPVVEDIFDCIKQNPGKISVLIIRGIDRMTRAGTLTYEQFKLRLYRYGVTLVDSYGTIQPQINTLAHLGVEYEWSKYSSSEITELILAHQSKKEVTDILTRTIGAEIDLVRNGYKVRSANDGYMNKVVFVEGKRKVIQVPDIERAHFYIKMFELRAEGAYTDIEIVQRINAMGFMSRPRNRWSLDKSHIIGQYDRLPLTVKQYQDILSNPIYCGVNTEKWLVKPIKTKSKGLVSIELFNKANRGKIFIEELPHNDITIHYNYSPQHTKRLKSNPQFPYRFILCPICYKPFAGSASTGKSGQKFPAYHCSRSHKYFRITKTDFEAAIEMFIKKVKYSEAFLPLLEKRLFRLYDEQMGNIQAETEKATDNINLLEIQKKQKIDAFPSTTNTIIRGELEKQVEELQSQINNSHSVKNNIQINDADINNFIIYVRDLMEHPEKLLNARNINRLKSLYALVFDEMPTYAEFTNGTPKLSFPFKLSEEFSHVKSPLVTLQRLDWNTAQELIKKWNTTYEQYPPDEISQVA